MNGTMWALNVIRESNTKMNIRTLNKSEDLDTGMSEMFAETLEEISRYIISNFQE